MTALAQALRTALLHFLWQGLAVALVLWMALFLLRKRSAQSRYLASCAALGILAVLPAVTAGVVYQAPAAGPAGALPAPLTGTASGGATLAPGFAALNWMVRLEPWALPLWSAGVLLFSLRLVWGCRRVSAMRRRGKPADAGILAIVAGLGARMGLARPVRVLTAALPDGPSVAGWLRPVLLLPPAAVLGLTPQQLEAVLAHELAHIRRYDHLVNAVQTLVETLLFYHPAVWWTSARIRDERELCCDDLAVRACGDALCFARALTKLERLRVMTPAAALGSTGGPMMHRVQRLIGAGHQECAPSKLSGIVAFSLGLACLALNVHWARGQEQPRQTGLSITVPYHEGDAPGVTVDLGGASVLHRTSVAYPEAARNSGIQGTVAVEVTLDAIGNVSDARVLSGPMELRKAVMSSVLDWHFTQDAAGSTRTVNVTFQRAAEASAPDVHTTAPEPVRTARTASSADGRPTTVSVTFSPDAEQKQKEIDNALRMIEELSQRQQELADKEKQGQLTAEQRWQQEMLGREAEQLNRQVQHERETVNLAEALSRTRQLQAELQASESAKEQNAAAAQDIRRQQELLERMLAEARTIAPESQADTKQAQQELQNLRAELAAIYRRQSERVGVAVRPNQSEPRFTPRILATIQVVGLTDAAKHDLLARLPIHDGDPLSEASLRAAREIVRKFDEHLNWQVMVSAADGMTLIRIEAPGASPVRK